MPVHILVLEAQAFFEEEIETLDFAFSTDIEEDCLLVAIFEVGVGAVADEELHDGVGYFVVDQDRREIKGRLAGLGFEAIDDDGLVFIEETFDFVDGPANITRGTNI